MVTVYRFRVYDSAADEFRPSRRWGTREAIEDIAHGEVIEESATEVDESVSRSDIPGLTSREFNPNRATGDGGFQTRMPE